MIIYTQKEMKLMKKVKSFAVKAAKSAAESALKRDANNTTCAAIYQPKVPANLKYFKRIQK